jgi:phosphohistidine phosphatase SixA
LAVKLFVVRHAHAGSRWDQSDGARPLSEKGWRQAEGIAATLEGQGVERLIASPAVRCVQTFEPLARRLGCEIEEDKRLFEGSSGSDALELVRDLEGGAVAICSHGDVVPDLLDALRLGDVKHKGHVLFAKASVWALKLDGSRIVKARYTPPSA